MKREDRKAAIAAYKERKIVSGIYALRCAPSGQCWIGRALDLSTVQNRIWFTLRQGSSPHRTLQAAWLTHGPDAFTFDEVERLEEDDALSRDLVLKDRLARWRAELGAEAI